MKTKLNVVFWNVHLEK